MDQFDLLDRILELKMLLSKAESNRDWVERERLSAELEKTKKQLKEEKNK